MKHITCKLMGGPCDAPLSASSYDEIMKVGWEHMEKDHPEMAAQIKATPMTDPKMVEWETKFKQTWADTPEM